MKCILYNQCKIHRKVHLPPVNSNAFLLVVWKNILWYMESVYFNNLEEKFASGFILQLNEYVLSFCCYGTFFLLMHKYVWHIRKA